MKIAPPPSILPLIPTFRSAVPVALLLLVLSGALAAQTGDLTPAAAEDLVPFATGAPEIDEGQIDRILHVSASGSDTTGDGTSGFPYRSVSKGLEKAKWFNLNLNEGVKVLVAPGTYVEGLDAANPAEYFPYPVGGNPIILEGAGWSPGAMTGDVVITGAEPLTGWTDNGNGTWTAPWPYDLGEIDLATVGSPPTYPEAYPKRDWLFVDGVTYYQFADASDPTLPNRTSSEGAFWIDTTVQTITAMPPAGADFAGAVSAGSIDVITRVSAFYGFRSGSEAGIPAPIAIRNIHFKRLGEYSLRFQSSNGLIIEDCHFTQCRHNGLVVSDSFNTTIRRVSINDNGVTGLGNQGDNVVVEDLQLNRNGRQAMLNRFLGWGYGGMKIGNSSQVTYRRWEVRDNEGVGVWFDTGLLEVDFSDSVITGSKAPAIFIEHNNVNSIPGLGNRTTLWVREVYIADSIGEPGATDGKGIQFAASENVYVEDCVIYNADWLLNFPSDGRGPQRNINLRRNVVASPGTQPIYYVAYGTNGWIESGDFTDTEGAFDTFSTVTNDNAYFRTATNGFLSRAFSPVDFSTWKLVNLYNGFNPNADKAVDSRSTFATSGYTGQPLVVVRPVVASRIENAGLVDGFQVSRVSNDTNGDLTVLYSVGGTAVSGVHYSPLSGNVVIPDGSRSVVVPVTLLDNGPGDPDLTLTLQPDTSASYLSLAGPSTLTITDDPVSEGDLMLERHDLSLWQGTGGPNLEFILSRNTVVTYPPHAIEASGSLEPGSWTTVWSSDGSIGSGNLIEITPMEGGYEQLRIRDPQQLAPVAPRFLRLRQD